MDKEKLEKGLEQKLPAAKALKEKVAKESKKNPSETDKQNFMVKNLDEASSVYADMINFVATQLVNNVEIIKQPILELVSWKDVINNKYRIEYFPVATANTTPDGFLPKDALTIDDFNADDAEPFTIVYENKEELYEKRQFNAGALFDSFKQGNGLSIVMGNETKNVKNVISRRKAGDVYKLLNESTTANLVVGTKGFTVMQKAKMIRLITKRMETPSTNRVSMLHNGTAKFFEHQAYSKDFTLIINSKYENDKAFDIDGTKFNVGQFSVTYGKVMTLDFDTIAEQYSLDEFKTRDAMLVENGAIMGALIYDLAQMLKEPKFKILKEWAMRYGFNKKGDRMIISFDNSVDATETPDEVVVKVETVTGA